MNVEVPMDGVILMIPVDEVIALHASVEVLENPDENLIKLRDTLSVIVLDIRLANESK